jgi:hypothetical protein
MMILRTGAAVGMEALLLRRGVRVGLPGRIPSFLRVWTGLIPGVSAVDTVLFVDADHPTTSRALPAVPLSSDKSLEPKQAHALKILDHAHAVSCAVAFVQLT